MGMHGRILAISFAKRDVFGPMAAANPPISTLPALPGGRLRFDALHGLDYQWQVLICAVVGTFMVMLDQTVVNIALPKITTVFGVGVHETQLVVTSYMLALAVIMPATGYLSDTFGTKRLYLITMALFTGGSLLCGLAWNNTSLVAFRVIQGLGGGMMSPLGMTMLFQVVAAQPAQHDHGLLRPAADARAGARPDARRLPGRVHRLARDLHPQRADRHARAVPGLHAAARDAARAWPEVRPARLRAVGGRLQRDAARPVRRGHRRLDQPGGPGRVSPSASSRCARGCGWS